MTRHLDITLGIFFSLFVAILILGASCSDDKSQPQTTELYKFELFTCDGKPLKEFVAYYENYNWVDASTGKAIHIAGGIVIRTKIQP